MTTFEKCKARAAVTYFVAATVWSAWMYYQGLSFPWPTLTSLFFGGGTFIALVLVPLIAIGQWKIVDEEAAVRKHILSQP